ncbi:hypothetical protein BS47DRAFT_1365751 [Hydnum rufescens UP504]|uniref:Uncharacterized protein n=1 Tax=Hydnum rufescens UP504 TaxID=1448309 RepID=A0A9P6AMW2_9AGAM|nr:hypothetical protein BS47DRAFT_1365751 [Hydnum rufescens UP504]
MYSISILAGKKHVEINAYHGTCKSPHACTAPEHATMGNVQHYTPTVAEHSPEPLHVTQQEVKHGTAHPLWRVSGTLRHPPFHENPPDENTMKPRTKYGRAQPHQTPSAQSLNNPHTTRRWGKLSTTRLLRWATVHENTPGKNMDKAHMKYRYTAAQDPTAAPALERLDCDHPSWCKNTPSASPGQAQFKLLTTRRRIKQSTTHLLQQVCGNLRSVNQDVWNGTRCTSPVLWGEFGLYNIHSIIVIM